MNEDTNKDLKSKLAGKFLAAQKESQWKVPRDKDEVRKPKLRMQRTVSGLLSVQNKNKNNNQVNKGNLGMSQQISKQDLSTSYNSGYKRLTSQRSGMLSYGDRLDSREFNFKDKMIAPKRVIDIPFR
eukprot:GHVR01025888.1.p1 GENE.GHVR01025888.1~~GHVR01025888.1.p1  ORF type:complete len:127 (+),score=24.65 GHVR01025888.1:917-1297(+)